SSRGIPVSENIRFAVQEKEYYQVPAIQSPHPVFNWEMDTSVKAITAVRVLVASTEEMLQSGQGDYWDSRKIPVKDCRLVYKGKVLKPRQLYYWKVQIWNDKDIVSNFSGVSTFYFAPDTGKKTFTHYPLAAEIQKAEHIQQQGPTRYFIDFGKDGFAQLYLHLNSNRSDSIWVEAAEALSGPGTILKSNGNIRYLRIGIYVEKGTHDYAITWPVNEKRNKRNPALMPGYIGEVFPFRYVVIENYDGQMDSRTIQRKLIHYPFDETASAFSSSDTVLNQVWELCRYSMKATSFTGYYVDGDRERLPYEADALINQLSHYSVDAEYSIARRSMEYLLFHPTWPTEWSLQNIMLAWNDYMYTGDDTYLKEFYPELQKKILMPLAGPNGLISTRARKQEADFLESIHMVKDFDGKHGLKDNVDWPQKGDYIGAEKEYGGETDGFVYTDYNAVVNAYYYHVLGLMQKIAKVLDKSADAERYQKEAEKVYRSFQLVFKDKTSGLYKDGDTTLHRSLHANMFALAFGLVPEKDIPVVVRFIKTR
ncbi:MAG: alpha-L-rhamnosidase, partial [Bacteroidota bacterium]|nr:alpha-L-rhamnosidase [Bacteroidota bacterium]